MVKGHEPEDSDDYDAKDMQKKQPVVADSESDEDYDSEAEHKKKHAPRHSDDEESFDQEEVKINPEDAGKTELFVRGLSNDTNEDDLRDVFEKHGELSKCKHLDRKQVAFVEYTSHESARKALAENGTELRGGILDVAFSGDKPAPGGRNQGPDGESSTVFCGNLGFHTSESAIRSFFEQAGEVAAIRIASDPESGRSKGFCHVEFAVPADAVKAVKDLNGYEIDGRTVRLDISAARGSRGGDRGGF